MFAILLVPSLKKIAEYRTESLIYYIGETKRSSLLSTIAASTEAHEEYSSNLSIRDLGTILQQVDLETRKLALALSGTYFSKIMITQLARKLIRNKTMIT